MSTSIQFLIFAIIFKNVEPFDLNRTIIVPVNYSQTFEATVNNSVEYILKYSSYIHVNQPPRVTVTTINATSEHPLMVVTRQPKELLSWKLPLLVESESGENNFMETSRTLCTDILKYKNRSIQYENPIINIATTSPNNTHFKVLVDFPEYFTILPSKKYSITVSPSEPQYFFYNFSTPSGLSDVQARGNNYDTVILEATSENDICTVISIQNISCPVYDLNQDITFRGFYETFTKQAGITIPNYKFPNGFYIVFVAKPDDSRCTKNIDFSLGKREKVIHLIIKPSISYNDYIYAVIVTLSAIGAFYIIFGVSFFFCSRQYMPRQMAYAEDVTATNSTDPICSSVEESVDETDYDHVEEVESDRHLRRCRGQPYLDDLARKSPKILVKKSYLYLYNVLVVALFYGLPVIQLVVTYQRVLNETGEQDLCYYNFLCSHPLGLLSDFNHVFSNIGYVLLGILFLIITYHRELSHKDQDFDRHYGIPQHYGLFYAMGVALMMEGILSGSYHVCPSKTNFQFDTSFMYVMAVLCMVKLYQNRHPDINANAYTTFGVLAVAIALCIIGILENTGSFWIVFVILHIIACFYISIKIYYMGCWSLNQVSLRRLGHIIRNDFWSGPLNVLKPCYKTRFVMLAVGNVFNWGLAGYALYTNPKNFGFFLLLIFMANTLFYFFFYIIMKYVHGEKVKFLTWLFLNISTLCAISAMYFFLHKAVSWSRTPAQSRTFNMECKLFQFYDFHDIWHFLSAIGMFFLFMGLLTLDDDLSHTHHSRIPVF